MKFRKMNEDTISCIVTEDDLLEYGLKIEDFLTNQSKTRDFISTLVEKAQKEVGYEAKTGALSVQLMPIPNNGLIITLSESSEESINDVINNIKKAVGLEGEHIAESIANNKSDFVRKIKADTSICILKFDNFNNILRFCTCLDESVQYTSKLYKDSIEELYYLAISKGKTSQRNFDRIIQLSTEFALGITDKLSFLSRCEEHFTCMIPKNAVEVLANL